MLKEKLKQAIDRLAEGRVLIIGDLAMDEMVFGHTSRLSREAPVIILDHQHTDLILGAGANAAHNAVKLGARCITTGLVGKDYYATQLQTALDRDGIAAIPVVDESRETIVKTRISGVAHHSVTQQMVRIDHGSKKPVSGQVEEKLINHIKEYAPKVDALLLSDYCYGVFSPKVIDCCFTMAKTHNLQVIVDSQGDLSRFQGATVICPNQIEAEHNLGFALSNEDKLREGGALLLERCKAEYIIMTLGNSGMAIFGHNNEFMHIPVFNHAHVFDVTGAGDTVVAALTLALITGASILEAATLGNLAASIVVRQFGAGTTHIGELTQALAALPNSLLDSLASQDMSKLHPPGESASSDRRA